MTTNTKTAVTQEQILAARKGLIPVGDLAWLGGFGNMLRKELSQWWGTRTWWIQILIWVLILNGITTIVMFSEPLPPAEALQEVMLVFTGLGAMAVSIATVTGVQNAIVGEKQLGTAAWILSKPASRSAFLLSKLLSYMIGFWTAGILIPSIIFYIETSLIFQISIPIVPFLVAVAVLELSQLFYLALVLMLGTLFESRGAIAGIGIGFLVGGFILTKMIPPEPLAITPWLLPNIGAALALGQPLPSFWLIPIIASAIWIIAMMAVALIRFQREEF